MKRLILAFLFCLSFCISSFTQEAQKIDEFTNIYCDEAKSRMDSLAIAFQDNPASQIHMIYYTGKLYRNYIYDKKSKSYKEVYQFPRQGEAKMIILRWVNYLTRSRGIAKEAIILVDGGFREDHTLENWIVPNGAEHPKPTPTLTKKDIKFRKGRARYVECEV